MKSNNTSPFTRIVVLCFVVILTIGGSLLWWKDAIAPFDTSDSTPVVFFVSRGESGRDVASQLASERIIRSPIGFYLLMKFLGIERNMQAGEYRLRRNMDAKTIALELTHGTVDVWVTILEGWRAEEIAIKIAKALDIPEKEFLSVAKEGYMFPDTYRFPTDATAGAVVLQLEDNFNKKVTLDIQNDIKKTGMTLDEIIILASIVEREGKTDEDRPLIAGILLNRLKQDWPLQADATLQYILGYQSKEKTWWKKDLQQEDKMIDSPYNTYKNMGLPPASISNPGLSAIKAVIYPKKTDYMYYIHDPEGIIHPARTAEEHQANIDTYLQ